MCCGGAGRSFRLADQGHPRLLMLRIGIPMAEDAGLFGEGPGSFQAAIANQPVPIAALYPRWKVTIYQPHEAVGGYQYADNDYLQFLIEWGWFGTLVWGMLIVGAIVKALAVTRMSCCDEAEVLVYVAALAALAGYWYTRWSTRPCRSHRFSCTRWPIWRFLVISAMALISV